MSWSIREMLARASGGRRTRKLVVPQLGEVTVRVMSAQEKDELDAWQTAHKDLIGWRARMVAYSLANEDGSPVEVNDEELDQIGELEWSTLDAIISAAAALSGMTVAAMEEIGKN